MVAHAFDLKTWRRSFEFYNQLGLDCREYLSPKTKVGKVCHKHFKNALCQG